MGRSRFSLSSTALAAVAGTFFIFFLFGGFYANDHPSFNHSTSGLLSPARQKSLDSILNSTLGFEKILAVNLPERQDHRDGLILASAVSNFHIDFVDGVHGNDVSSKVLPVEHGVDLPAGAVGSWRAHMDALSKVVQNNWTTALIFEDDIDWDVRLRSILQDVAVASDGLLRSSSPPETVISVGGLAQAPTSPISPYGDGWDVLWLGHCDMEIHEEDTPVVVQQHHDTVPQLRHLSSCDPGKPCTLSRFPNHTRAVFRSRMGVCSFGYAVSQAGARALLLEIGLRKFTEAFDLMLQHFCDGTYGFEKPRVCIGVLPQIFDHHRCKGPSAIDSDINAPDGSYRDKAFTPNVRYSVRLNMDKLLRGETDYTDQFPDDMLD